MIRLLTFFFLALVSISFSNEAQLFSEKHYLHSEQIAVTEKGIFVNIKEITIPLDAIYHDSLGLFILPNLAAKTCPNGHVSVTWWGGCAIATCLYYAYDMN